MHHAEYVDICVTNNIKEYIQSNLQKTPRLLWEEIGLSNTNITEKQIYSWWLNYSQSVWKKDQNQIVSSIKVIESYNNIEILFSTVNTEVTVIAFAVTKMIHNLGIKAKEIGIDATYLDFYSNVALLQPEAENSEENTDLLIQSAIRNKTKKISFVFCPAENHNNIIDLITKHFYQHPFIPVYNNQYYTKEQIYENAIKEMYLYCKENNLKWAWSYFWMQ
ncbi:4851_t:CDS:2 [Cetraspora pellucida]|uniref:4851_t:CDS:1 n=1 Tax=Cetraspora pellucida TaxID=1433469 RepID=A0ACA9KN43_9GLOM|nr:4851_t:CDS:2 [Cetraspora pellucida]